MVPEWFAEEPTGLRDSVERHIISVFVDTKRTPRSTPLSLLFPAPKAGRQRPCGDEVGDCLVPLLALSEFEEYAYLTCVILRGAIVIW